VWQPSAALNFQRRCRKISIVVLLMMILFGATTAAEAGETNQAKLKVSGYGFFGNRQLKNLLVTLQPEGAKPEFYDANFIEDCALLLVSTLRRDGYLKPRVVAHVTLDDKKTVDFEWLESGREPLPRPLRARRVRFKIHKGMLYHYASVQIEGLRIMSVKEARAFFIEKDVLIHFKDTRIYTPEKLKQSLNNLQETMERRGYESAKVEVAQLEQNDRTGKVAVRIKATEGRKSLVRSIRKEIYLESTNVVHEASLIKTNGVFSQPWAQDFKQNLRTIYYHQGYPDASVELVKTNKEEGDYVIEFDLLAKVFTGPRIKLDKVKFEGYRKTAPTFLAKRVGLKEGSDLDRVKVEEGRYRLARLGVFDSVDLRYDLINEQERDVIYTVKEGKRMDLSVLAGYGSYELLRGGLEFEQFNVWGRAHHARLRLIQSFKASSGDYTYNVPSIFGGDVDLFLTATGLRRDEVSFVREEYGGGVGLRRAFKAISSDLSVRYQYQVLNASKVDPGLATEGLPSASVGTIIAELRHDRRDNPLYPRKGYKVFSNLEIGSSYIGGEANYQRFEAAGAYHFPLYDSGWLNLGLSHGVLLTIGSKAIDLPFNRRFFPGGENSIRGYQEGEASPRNAAGQFTGAETYVLGNIEFEQALTKAFSLVLFSDSIGFARELSDYPLNESLFAAGAGLRWKTIVGPIRLEYGHNLNPREGDPSGTIHFSMGFPF
jgi:outer membrane protein insertion porin family